MTEAFLMSEFALERVNSFSSDETEDYVHVTSMPMDDIIAQQLAGCMESFQNYLQNVLGVQVQPSFSFDSLQRLSIVLLILERLLRPFQQISKTFNSSSLDSSTTSTTTTTTTAMKDPSESMDQLQLLMAISFAFLFSKCEDRQNRNDDSISWQEEFCFILTILFTLTFLRPFLPLFLLSLIAVVLFRNFHWKETVIFMLSFTISSVLWSSVICEEE